MQGVETVERAKALDFGVTMVITIVDDDGDGDLIDWRVRWSWIKGILLIGIELGAVCESESE